VQEITLMPFRESEFSELASIILQIDYFYSTN
jgi:hypothetical protein